MIDLTKFNLLKRPNPSGLLGLGLDGSRLDGVVLRRTNGSLQLQQSFSTTLSLDPLTNEPELVGREIRNHLDAAEVRERHCIVGLPLKWALTAHTKLPELPEADIASFLQIEAERGFPCDVATLLLATSHCQSASGERHATLVGIPRNHVALLERVLRAAQLKPVSFSLGLTALQPAEVEASNGILALVIGESHVGLQVTCGGGVAALRALEGALEIEGGQRRLYADLVAREARITLGQLPAEMRDTVRRVRIFGPRDLAQQLADEIELRLEAMDLEVAVVSSYAAREFGVQLPPDATVSPAFSLAAARLAGRKTPFEFLPPRVTAWQQVTARYSSGKLRTVGAVAAAVLFIIASLFSFQQVQLWRLRSQWSRMQAKVHELESIQQQIHKFRPWFDESLRSMTILRQLTSAFPEDGVVSAKTVEIRDPNTVTCSGVAGNNQALLKTLEHLRATGEVADLKVDRIQGRAPVQFTFDFHWVEGGRHAN
ncbi:MAG: hypothetical protein HY298_05605 [Verrucomicrobia bacterium]|nr:hypothetical protein [Verrucomicrobiota bacterium]